MSYDVTKLQSELHQNIPLLNKTSVLFIMLFYLLLIVYVPVFSLMTLVVLAKLFYIIPYWLSLDHIGILL